MGRAAGGDAFRVVLDAAGKTWRGAILRIATALEMAYNAPNQPPPPPRCFDGRAHGASSEAPSFYEGNLREPASPQSAGLSGNLFYQKYRSNRSETPVSRPLRASGMTTSPALNRRVQGLRP